MAKSNFEINEKPSSDLSEEIEKAYDTHEMIFDYHTHTVFSHGKGTIEDNVKAAIDAGLKAVAISDHGPGHLSYGVKRENFRVMRDEIDALQEKYPQIKIYLSVEANVISKPPYIDLKEEERKYFDFIIAGYHYGVLHGKCISNYLENHIGAPGFIKKYLKEYNTEMTLKALENNDITILTHPGDKAQFDIAEIAKSCAKTGTLMEISTWHPHLTVDEIQISMKENVFYVVSSDAHTPNRVGSWKGGVKRAVEAGLDLDRIVNIRKVRF